MSGQEGNIGNYVQDVLKKPAKKSASSNREKVGIINVSLVERLRYSQLGMLIFKLRLLDAYHIYSHGKDSLPRPQVAASAPLISKAVSPLLPLPPLCLPLTCAPSIFVTSRDLAMT